MQTRDVLIASIVDIYESILIRYGRYRRKLWILKCEMLKQETMQNKGLKR